MRTRAQVGWLLASFDYNIYVKRGRLSQYTPVPWTRFLAGGQTTERLASNATVTAVPPQPAVAEDPTDPNLGVTA